MASENDLENRLREQIDREVDDLLRRAREDGSALLARTREECERRLSSARKRFREEASLRRRRALARAELEGKNLLLRRRREEINRLFQEATEAIRHMEKNRPAEFAELLWSVFSSCRGMIPGETVRVRLGLGAEGILERLKKERGVEIETTEAFAGLLVESLDGHVHCDGSIEALLSNLRQEKEAELEEILFGEGTDDDP